MLLTSILALKTAPMSLVIVLRNTSPLGTLLIERFYPEPLRISGFMLASICLMIAGGVTIPAPESSGLGWKLTKKNHPILMVDQLIIIFPIQMAIWVVLVPHVPGPRGNPPVWSRLAQWNHFCTKPQWIKKMEQEPWWKNLVSTHYIDFPSSNSIWIKITNRHHI